MLRLDQLGFLLTAGERARLMRESADGGFAVEVLTSAPDVPLMTLSINGDMAMQQGRWEDRLMHFELPTSC